MDQFCLHRRWRRDVCRAGGKYRRHSIRIICRPKIRMAATTCGLDRQQTRWIDQQFLVIVGGHHRRFSSTYMVRSARWKAWPGRLPAAITTGVGRFCGGMRQWAHARLPSWRRRRVIFTVMMMMQMSYGDKPAKRTTKALAAAAGGKVVHAWTGQNHIMV